MRAREASEPARARGDEPRAPAVEPRERRGDRGRDGRDRGGQERQREHLHDDGHGNDVRRDGDKRNLVELEPCHGSRRHPARRRDADQLRNRARDGVALERADDARRDDEDRGDGGERELEAGVEQRVRVPGEQNRGADEKRLPAVALARREPRDPAEQRGDRRADDGRVEPDSERVRGHCAEGRELGGESPEAQEEDDCDDGARHRSDLQPVDGEAVVQP